MSHQSLDQGETSGPLHDNREGCSATDSPYPATRVRDFALEHAPPSPLFFGSNDSQPDSPYFGDQFNGDSNPRSPIRPPATNAHDNGPFSSNDNRPGSPYLEDYDDGDSKPKSPTRSPRATESHDDGALLADQFLDNMSAPVQEIRAYGALDDFRAVYPKAARGLSAQINPTSRDEFTQKYHQRHGGNSDPRDRELVMKHVLPSLVDLATAVVERTRSDCSSIVRDQAYHEYEAYANENREAFIQKLMEEAWPHALQRMRTRSQRWYERKMAGYERRLEAFEDREIDRIDGEMDEMRKEREIEVIEEIEEYKLREYSHHQEYLLKQTENAQAAVDEKMKQYRREEEEKCLKDILSEKERCKAIMRANLKREVEEERKQEIAAMEYQMSGVESRKRAQLDSEIEELRSKMLLKVADEAASENGADGASINEEKTPPPVNGPGSPANPPVQDDGYASSEHSEDIEGDTTLINDKANSPPARKKTSRGRKRSRSDSNDESSSDWEKPAISLESDEPAKTATEDERPSKRSCINRMFDITDSVPSASPTTNPLYYGVSNNVPEAANPLNDDSSEEKTKNHWSSYFPASGLSLNMPAPAVVGQITTPTTPSVQQNAVAGAPPKQKYSFGKINTLNEDGSL